MSHYLEKVSSSLLRSASACESSSFSRKLDNYDQQWAILHELGNLMICNAVSILTDQPVQIEDVVESANRVAANHAMLRSKIVSKPQGKSRWAKFYEESTAPLDVQYTTGDWQTVWKKEQQIPFDTENGPLWKLRCLQSNASQDYGLAKDGRKVRLYRTWFVACFHHGVMDGMSRQRFWEELSEALRSVGLEGGSALSSQPSTTPSTPSSEREVDASSDKSDNSSVDASETSSVARPISSVVKKTILQRVLDPIYAMGDRVILSFGIFLTLFFRHMRVAKSNPFSRVYSSEEVGDSEESYTGIVPVVFDETTTKKLAELSKKWKTPLNALLTGIAAQGVQDMVAEKEEIEADLDLYTMQAISTRRWFTPENLVAPSCDEDEALNLPAMGCYTTLMGLNLKVPKDKTEFQNFVGRINSTVHDKVDRPTPAAALGEWQVVTNFLTNASESGQLEKLKDLVNPTVRPSVFLISNTGRWQQKEQDLTVITEEEEADLCAAGEDVKFVAIESSWSCVNQHKAGNNLFSHNLVTMNGKLHWSLQYASRFTNQQCATKYAQKIQKIVESLAHNEAL